MFAFLHKSQKQSKGMNWRHKRGNVIDDLIGWRQRINWRKSVGGEVLFHNRSLPDRVAAIPNTLKVIISFVYFS